MCQRDSNAQVSIASEKISDNSKYKMGKKDLYFYAFYSIYKQCDMRAKAKGLLHHMFCLFPKPMNPPITSLDY